MSLSVVLTVSALLGVLGFKLERYLGPVFSLLIHILEDVSEEMGSRLESDEAEDIIEGNATNNLKDEAEEVNDGVQVDDCSTSSSAVQRQCLEMINSIWIKYPEACNNRAFVDRVLTVVQPWMCDLAKVDAHISRYYQKHSLLLLVVGHPRICEIYANWITATIPVHAKPSSCFPVLGMCDS